MRIVREHFRRLREDKRGSMVIETALLAPVFMLLLFGVLQAGVWLQNYNAVRSATLDASRQILIEYQKDNSLSDEQIRRVVLARATTAPYFLKSDNLTVTIDRKLTTRVTGTTEMDVELRYTIDSFLPISDLPGGTVTYERPVFVVG
ncbi:MAG: hypothetical protein CL955_04605 [Erythrobacteraceae bacterium]|nr:hypothetical protein [Erythrobacteraceae bacterium]